MLDLTEHGNILEGHSIKNDPARVAELVDALDLGSRFWGFDSLLGYKNAFVVELVDTLV